MAKKEREVNKIGAKNSVKLTETARKIIEADKELNIYNNAHTKVFMFTNY